MDKESKEFHDTTFEPVEVTPQEETPEVTPPVDTETNTEVISTEEQSVPQADNDTVRYQYWQSEAMRKENALRQMQQEIETLRQSQTQKPKDEIPQKPATDDPNEWLQYNANMNEYNAKLINQLREERNNELKQRQEYEKQMYARNETINKLTEVTKNPQKAQKILGFFADTKNLQDPALYNVMYDAAQAYLTKSSPAKSFSPPPPVDGGESVKTKKDPNDEFNNQLGETNKYKL